MRLQTRCTGGQRPSMPLLRACVPSGPTAGWCCAGPVCADAAHPQDFSDRKDNRSLLQSGLPGAGRHLPRLRPLPPPARRRSAAAGPAEWRWDVFFTEIVRSVFAGTWDSAPGGRAINYWWGLKSGAERVEYPTRLNDGTSSCSRWQSASSAMGDTGFPDRELQSGPCPSPCGFRHLYAQGTDGDGLAGRVREGELPSYDRTGRQDPQPFEHQWSGQRKGNAAETGKDPRIEKNGAKAS